MGFIAPVLALAGGVVSYMGAQQSAKAMEQAGEQANERAKLEAANMQAETRENVFRKRTTNAERLAELRQSMLAYGGGGGSSTDVFGKAAGRLELEILDSVRAGEGAVRARRNEGETALWNANAQAAGVRTSAIGNLFGSIGSAVGSLSGPSPKLTSLY